jgi:predicted enzyme related to lactoylglutathione lyase
MSRPVHFEIHATDPAALMDFYTKLFGWSFNKWDGGEYWMISTGPNERPGINGGLVPRRGPAPEANAAVSGFVNTIGVEDIDASLSGVEAYGNGAIVALPKMPVPGVGWLAYVRDPDGNIFGMMQADSNAA